MINYLFQEQNWQTQLSDLITDPQELLETLELSQEQLLSGALLAVNQFRLRVTRAFVGSLNIGEEAKRFVLGENARRVYGV